MQKELILASRDDGLGERLRAILNALYIAKRLNFDFGFIWHPLNASETEVAKNKLAPVVVPCVDEIFSKEFIQKYSYNGIFENRMDEFGKFKRKSINSLKDTKVLNFPIHATQKRLDTIFNDLDTKEYKLNLIKIWQELDFAPKIKEILKKAEEKIINLKENITTSDKICVLHIRAGDAIFLNEFQRQIIRPNIFARALNFTLAIEIINKELKNNNAIIVFSDDLSLLECFKNELPTLLNLNETQKKKLFFSIDFCDEKDYAYKALYENALMSWSDKIYYTKTSGYANLAVLTGKYKEDIGIYEYFSNEEQYKIIQKYLDRINVHSFHKSFVCFHGFRLAKILKKPLEEIKFWLKKAHFYNPNNDAFHLLWIEILFKEKRIKEVNGYIANLLIQRESAFLETLFCDNTRYYYDFMFDYFLKYAKKGFENIDYIASVIALNLGCKELFEFYFKDIKGKFNTPFDFGKNLGAEFLMKNHLSYKLGEAMVKNSFALKTLLKNPLDLLIIYLHFKKDKFKHIRSLSSYKDHEKALKFVKVHPYYKIRLCFNQSAKNLV